MKIQKGLVKDQGYDDVNCTYGICEDGRTYYFIENGSLSNGNIIVSTNLKEAIGHAPNNFLGVIKADGSIVIPCENKVLKTINDKLLLVEKTTPVSKNVLDAMQDRADPLAANKLVSAAANIKDRLNAKIGRDGRFVFNNQFSEAAIYDFDGNNLMNDFYSYIAMDDDTIYLSKNVTTEDVVEYSINVPVIKNDVVETNGFEIPTENIVNPEQENLDITNTGVTKENLDKQINKEVENNFAQKEDSLNIAPVAVSIPVSEEVSSNDISTAPVVEEEKNEIIPEKVDVKDYDITATIQNTVNEKIIAEEKNEVVEDFQKEEEKAIENNKVIDFNSFKNEPLGTETVNKVFDSKYEDPDTVIESANNVMKELIKQNKSQRDVMKDQDSRIEILEEDNKLLTQQCEDVNSENEDLKRKVTRYESIIEKYAKKLNVLSDKVDSQTKTISEQQKRLDILEPQIAGRHELGNTVEEALEILNEDEIDNVYTKSYVA